MVCNGKSRENMDDLLGFPRGNGNLQGSMKPNNNHESWPDQHRLNVTLCQILENQPGSSFPRGARS